MNRRRYNAFSIRQRKVAAEINPHIIQKDQVAVSPMVGRPGIMGQSNSRIKQKVRIVS